MRCRVFRNDATRLRRFRDSVESGSTCARHREHICLLMAQFRQGLRLVMPRTVRMEFPGATGAAGAFWAEELHRVRVRAGVELPSSEIASLFLFRFFQVRSYAREKMGTFFWCHDSVTNVEFGGIGRYWQGACHVYCVP